MKVSKSLIGMIIFVILMVLTTIIFGVLYLNYHLSAYIYLYNTFLCTSYHFIMRLLVGAIIDAIYKNKEFHYDSFWYQKHFYEDFLFKILGIKYLKRFAITARPEYFDIKKVTLAKMLHSMTQAEVVHEIIIILSFLPCLMIIWYG